MKVENIEEKMVGVTEVDKKKHIIVTHVTIRQSIFFLVLKLLFIEVSAALGVILFHTVLLGSGLMSQPSTLGLFNVPLFALLVVLKVVLTLYVINRWLNEYYEITPDEVVHRKGRIMREEERYTVRHIASVKVEQGMLGRMFNFGTIRAHNWARGKDIYLYLVHNPMKYAQILQELVPEADKEKRVLREHLVENVDE